MPSTRVTMLVGVGFAIAFGAWWTIHNWPTASCALIPQKESFDVAFCGTHERLRNHRERPDAAIDWLLANHGEAPSHQVMIILADWALDEPDSFIELLSRVEAEDAEVLIWRIAFAVTDGGRSERFTSAFGPHAHESDRLRQILDQLEGRGRPHG